MFFYFLLFALYFRPFACGFLEWDVEFEISNNNSSQTFDTTTTAQSITTRADEINISFGEEDHFFIFSIDKETKTISSLPNLVGMGNQASNCNVLSFIDFPVNTCMILVLGKIVFAENELEKYFLSHKLDFFHRSIEGITYRGKIDTRAVVSEETIAPIISMIKLHVKKARMEVRETEAAFSLITLSNPALYRSPIICPINENSKGILLDSSSNPFLIDGNIAASSTEDQTVVLNYMFNEENVLSFVFFTSLFDFKHSVGFSRAKSSEAFIKVSEDCISTDYFNELIDDLALEYNTFMNSGKPIFSLGWVSLSSQEDTESLDIQEDTDSYKSQEYDTIVSFSKEM